MEIIKAESIITSQYDQFFGHGGIVENAYATDLALMFDVEIHIENFGYERDGNTKREEWARDFFQQITIVVTARHQVFVKINNGEWSNPSNHDSCWRSDGLSVIWETMREGWEHCWALVPEEHQQNMRNMHKFCNINGGLFNKGAVRFARVKSEPSYDGYGRRKLTEIRPVKFTVQIEE